MRVASLLPSGTESVALVGAEGDLVGRSRECDHPATVQGLPALTRTRKTLRNASGAIDRAVREILQDSLTVCEVDVGALRLAEIRTPDVRPDVADLGDLLEPELAGAAAWIEYPRQVTEAFALHVGAERVGVRQLVADGPHCPPRSPPPDGARRRVLTLDWLD